MKNIPFFFSTCLRIAGEYENRLIIDGKMAWMARSPNVDE